MRIAVVGTGYVGLVSGTCLAETGVTVTCVDVNSAKIELLNNGGMPIYEPGLAELVRRNREDGRLFFTTSLQEALRDADAVFIAVGTPPDEDGSADLQYNHVWSPRFREPHPAHSAGRHSHPHQAGFPRQ